MVMVNMVYKVSVYREQTAYRCTPDMSIVSFNPYPSDRGAGVASQAHPLDSYGSPLGVLKFSKEAVWRGL
jgi:hypothetical protein